MAKLNDPFTQVRFRDFEAFPFEVIVKKRFLGGHGLALHDLPDLVRRRDRSDNRIRLKSGARHVNLYPGSFGIGLEAVRKAPPAAGIDSSLPRAISAEEPLDIDTLRMRFAREARKAVAKVSRVAPRNLLLRACLRWILYCFRS